MSYKISIKIGDTVLKGSGATALEAMQKIEKPQKIFTKGVVTVSTGKKERVHVLAPMKLRRLFYPNFQHILVRNLAFGL